MVPEGYQSHEYGLFNKKGERVGLYSTRKLANKEKLALQIKTGKCFRIGIVER